VPLPDGHLLVVQRTRIANAMKPPYIPEGE